MEVLAFKPMHELLHDLVLDASALQSTQCKFLTKYLTELGAKSVIVEDDYNDGCYLSEYSNYYSKCHESYERHAHRIHFFTTEKEKLEIQLNISLVCFDDSDQEGAINDDYLGFIVLKPLPKSIIGRTCLKTYSEINVDSRRVFPILRKYSVLLHSLQLSVDSIAFQEQDSEVAACSTAAIWYSMHALIRKVTVEEIASTYDITSHASATYIKRSQGEVARRFPSSGLGLEQIEAYLRSIGMECIVCGATLERSSSQVAEYLYAYGRGGYPMILVGNLYVSERPGDQHVKLGLHAMTALGYSEGMEFSPGNRSNRIRKIFAHDDNVGPFTSYALNQCAKGDFVKFLNPSPLGNLQGERSVVDIINAVTQSGGVETSIEKSITGYLANESGPVNEGVSFRKFTPEYFIIPIPQKVRFPYEGISLFAAQIDQFHQRWGAFRYAPGAPLPKISWSIELSNVTKFKSTLRTCSTIDAENLLEVLLTPMPKHIWILNFSTKTADGQEDLLLTFIFDATSLRQSGGVLGFVPYDRIEGAQTFTAIVMTLLESLDENSLDGMDWDLMQIMRSARALVRASLQAESQQDDEEQDGSDRDPVQ